MGELVGAGAFGGLVAEMLFLADLYNEKKQPKLPAWTRTRTYRAFACARVVVGAGLVFIYIRTNITLTDFLAFHVGIAAPVLARGFAAVAPSIPTGPTD